MSSGARAGREQQDNVGWQCEFLRRAPVGLIRLDHLLPETVPTAAPSPLQAGSHRAHQRHLGQPPAAGCVRLAMTRPAQSEVARDAPLLQRGEVRLVGKAGIARDLPRLAPKMSANPVYKRKRCLGGTFRQTV